QPIRDDPSRVVPAVPRELVERLPENTGADGMPHDRPVVVGDVELDVLLAPEPESDPRLRQLRREEGWNPCAQDGTVLELEPLGDRERGRSRSEQPGDDQRGSV